MSAAAITAAGPNQSGDIGTTDRRAQWRGSAWLLAQWMRRDYIVRYRQSLLGLAWAVLQPLVLLAIYGLVFVHVLHVAVPKVPYVVFAYCGLTPWSFVASSVAMGVQSVLAAQPIITKVWFPREIVPLAAVGVSLIDLGISTMILLVLAAAFGTGLHVAMLALVPLYLGLVLLISGIVVAASAFTVFVRDIRQAVPLLLQAAFIGTPIMYPVSRASGTVHRLITLNPIAVTIAGIRRAVIDGQWPSAATLLVPILIGAVVLAVALAYFRSVEQRFPDVM